jgi:hypothetical protein
MIRSAMLPNIAQLYHNSTLHCTRQSEARLGLLLRKCQRGKPLPSLPFCRIARVALLKTFRPKSCKAKRISANQTGEKLAVYSALR